MAQKPDQSQFDKLPNIARGAKAESIQAASGEVWTVTVERRLSGGKFQVQS